MPQNHHILDTPIEYLKGVGPKKGASLKTELGIFTFGQLLQHYPFRYIDKTQLQQIAQLSPDSQDVQLKGRILSVKTIGEGRAKRIAATITDDTGTLELVWFKGIHYIRQYLQVGKEYLVFGKPTFKYRPSISHPEMELVTAEKAIQFESRLEAVYSTTEKLKSSGLDSKGIYRLQKALFDKLQKKDIPEIFPDSLLTDHQLIGRWEAFKNVHLPEKDKLIQAAQFRLKFEEFFFIQLRLVAKKVNRHQRLNGFEFPAIGKHFNQFYHEVLPFELTNAQKRVLKEIRRDTMTGTQMNRLLQGDVGSGKTIVALITMLMAADSDFQSCLMAPTEILAQQHFESISNLLKDMDLRVDLLTGSVKGRKRRSVLEKLALGMTDILIGTHALIEDTVVFKNLGMVVVDEQHRFGVAQRAKLWEKNTKPPHVLVMTATPIPRTLAMTVYGDLDVSVIDELPPGRKAIQTFHFFEKKRLKVFNFLRSEIAKGRQAYIVYPLINESETLDYKDLMDGYESFSRAFPLPDYRIGLLHGQMHTIDKDTEMQRFKEGKTHIMLATTVIEVGVNVPNASVMVIESGERFGLAQLHQLRGRVGRGAEQSYCILMTGNKLSKEGKKRMQTMVETTDGFKIAEVDMKLRGAGDLEGTQQSGALSLRLADIMKDNKILQLARQAAATLLQDDPTLSKIENARLKYYLVNAKDEATRSKWSRIS